ncbi:TPA: hypothetical protein ACGD2I_002562 [Aeromonas hydrophila]|uniref:hypothetical protein n=1 Tax=Aeromonas hydrophila TaxID=644 RepID=UPI0021E7560E|nr:hypothetical protein [Aeromonas hydrophila]MCV3295439.1 hypothetical protein [Aeromonas hydrophila]WDA22748.1 hypothetical protein PSC74_11775 [Aeromonas hydrophila]WES92811.1 hypothetical protein PY368_20460 [Aeromonas hydrophila]
MRKLTLLIVFIFFLDGCSIRPKNHYSYRGVYTQGFEISTFTSCGSDNSYWLWAADERLMERLDEKIDRIRDEKGHPYPSLYLEMVAVDEGKSEDGFPADYDSTLNMIELVRYSQQIPYQCQHPL